MDDKEFFESLAAKTSPKGRNALDRVRRACDALEKSDISISVAAVGKWCGDEGPGAPSIHNSKDSLKAYVMWRSGRQRIVPKNGSGPIQSITIADPIAQAAYDTLKAERGVLHAENLRLKSALKNLSPVAFDRLVAGDYPSARAPEAGVEADRESIKSAAAKMGTDDALLKLGFRRHETGAILMPGRVPEVFLTVRELAALRSLMANC